jgi:hypothetical protein
MRCRAGRVALAIVLEALNALALTGVTRETAVTLAIVICCTRRLDRAAVAIDRMASGGGRITRALRRRGIIALAPSTGETAQQRNSEK